MTIRKMSVGAASVAFIAFSSPAFADGGAITSFVLPKLVNFVIDFVTAAKSNTSAAVVATATSTDGTTTVPDSDTGFFSADASATASSGNLAEKSISAHAEWFAFSENEATVTPTPSVFIVPNGLSTFAYGEAKVKGVFALLKEALGQPLIALPDSRPTGELIIPLSMSFDFSEHGSYQFDVSLELQDGTIFDLANGAAGGGGNSLNLPYLEMTDPTLAASVQAQYLGIVGGATGQVSFNLGEGVLPTSADGVYGLPVTVDLEEPFQLNSDLQGQFSAAVPETETWILMCVGFLGLVVAGRQRVSRLASQ